MEFFDFKSEGQFNLHEEYSKLEEAKIETPNERKIKDAQHVIKELGVKYVEGSSLDEFEKNFENLETFLSRFRTDSPEVENMSTQERTKLFGYAITMQKQFENIYQNLRFNFEMTRDEWHFVFNVLTNRLKYNGNEVFNFWQLKIDFLDSVDGQFKSLPKEIDSVILTTAVRNLILLSHLLMKYEESAGNKSFYHFKNILFEIAQMTKLFNAYGVMAERLGNKMTQWINVLGDMDNLSDDARIEKLNSEEIVEG